MDKTSENNKDFLDPKEYNSLIVGGEKETKSNAKSKANLIALLADTNDRDTREDVLKLIKNEPKALDLLIEAIEDKKLAQYRVDLIAACWESAIDCRSKINYFTNLAINADYLCCIEAFSVIYGMDTPVDQAELEKSITQLNFAIQKGKDDKTELLKQIAEVLGTLKQ